MSSHLAKAVALLLVVGLQGCLFAPQPHQDMRIRIDRIGLPSDFTLVYRMSSGHTSRFAGSPPPYVTHEYSVAMDREPSVCEELENLLGLEETPVPRPGGPDHQSDGVYCRFDSKIFAGWRGFLLGIPRYRLMVASKPRADARELSDAACDRILIYLGERELADNLGLLGPKCRVPKDHAIVVIRIYM